MVAAAELVVTLERLCKEPNKLLNYDEECGCFTEESLAGLVCTVGELLTWPSASNVIPGQVSLPSITLSLLDVLINWCLSKLNLGSLCPRQVNFTVDIRAMDDKVRETIVTSFSRLVLQRCDDRLVDCRVEHKVSRATESAFIFAIRLQYCAEPCDN
jgi:allantoate deiminase